MAHDPTLNCLAIGETSSTMVGLVLLWGLVVGHLNAKRIEIPLVTQSCECSELKSKLRIIMWVIF